MSDFNKQDDGTITDYQTYYFDFDEAGRPTLYLVDRSKITLKEAVEKTHRFYKKFAVQHAAELTKENTDERN